MGNKQGRRRESQLVYPRSTSAINPSLPPNAVNILTNCLNKLPLVLDKNGREEVIRRVEIIDTEDTQEHVLRKGEEPTGIYVLVSGKVIVVSENQKFVLREIPVGDCFGEVSVLFKTTCTADVCTINRCRLLVLKTSDARQLFTIPTEVTLLEWFKQRRYFDTSKLFGDQQLLREIALSMLQQSPVLRGWRIEALKAVVKTLKQGIIVLYPADSIIVKEGWKGQEMYILVHGELKFSTGDQELATFGAGERGFCFGEEGFFAGTGRRTTVRAVVPCQVISLRQENFHDAVTQYPAECRLLGELNVKWKQQVNRRDSELYLKYGGALDLEILRMTLKQTEEFKLCPPGFLYVLALAMVIKEVEAGNAVLTESEYQNGGTLFVVLQGSVIVMGGNLPTRHIMHHKEFFWKKSSMPDKGWIRAEELCVTAFFPQEALREARNTFPDVELSLG